MVNQDILAQRLAHLLGAEHVFSDLETRARIKIDGIIPGLVARPRDASQISELVALARELKAAIVPKGRGNALHLGRTPSRADILLDLSLLDRVLEHDRGNLTITCQAGAPLSSAYDQVEAAGQILPLDPPLAPNRSFGGVVASASVGPSRLGYGSLRDLLFGVRAVLGTGKAVRFGGKVIKDVAGFNLARMFIGSLGTLGIITELTLRLYVRPQVRQTVVACFDELETAAQALSQFPLPCSGVVAAEILGSRIKLKVSQLYNGNCLALAFAGLERDVQELVRRAKDVCARLKPREIAVLAGEQDRELWAAIRDLASGYRADGEGLLLRATCLVSRQSKLLMALEDLAYEYGLSLTIWAHGGCGIIYGMVEDGRMAELIRFAAQARSLAHSQGGSLVLESAPPAVKKEICPWGPVPSGFQLMARIKAGLDPSGIMNPGRFWGGI